MKKAIMGLFAFATLGLAAQAEARLCARMYEHSGFRGEVRRAEDGDRVGNIGSLWNDQISSVRVQSGCSLDVWKDTRFEGDHAVWRGEISNVGSAWNDKVTAYMCTCR